MKRIFITGSSDGLGFLAGKQLIEQGHHVVLHARNETKARALQSKLPDCKAVVVGDVSTVEEMKSVAAQANALGRFDVVIHNVAIGAYESRLLTQDGITQIFAVNVVAPYVLTALMDQPDRLIYLSSDMHAGGADSLADPQWENKVWNSQQAYSDTKLHDLLLSMYFARRWPAVLVNALDPGWVPTRLGGDNAPGNVLDGARTQVWLAVSEDASANVSGSYFYHQKARPFKRAASRVELQDALVAYLVRLTGVSPP